MKNLMRTILTNAGLSFGAFGTNPDKLCGAQPNFVTIDPVQADILQNLASNFVTIDGKISGARVDLIIMDDIEPDFHTLDERSDNAEIALDAYTAAAGSTGSDRQDVVELIADLLHLLDDTFPPAGEHPLNYASHLLDALKTYHRDLAIN